MMPEVIHLHLGLAPVGRHGHVFFHALCLHSSFAHSDHVNVLHGL